MGFNLWCCLWFEFVWFSLCSGLAWIGLAGDSWWWDFGFDYAFLICLVVAWLYCMVFAACLFLCVLVGFDW